MFRRCKHEHLRCIHGDEVWARMSWWYGTARRVACLDCGKALDRKLLDVCSDTGKRHTFPAGRET